MKIIGHRGAKGLAPENTLAGFRKALEHHVDEIELDVRLTKDGKTVLLHDAQLTDTAGNQLSVAESSFAELRQHKADLTTLSEAIKTVNRLVPIVIEVKRAVPTAPVIKIITSFLADGWQVGDFRLASYDQKILRDLHAALPDIQKIVIEDWSSLRARRRMREVNTNRVSMLEYWLWAGFIRAVSRGGWELYVFPAKKDRLWARLLLGERANNPRKLAAWAKSGLTGTTTDFPDRFEH